MSEGKVHGVDQALKQDVKATQPADPTPMVTGGDMGDDKTKDLEVVVLAEATTSATRLTEHVNPEPQSVPGQDGSAEAMPLPSDSQTPRTEQSGQA